MSACPEQDREPDWNLAKALYVSGLPPREIVRQANVPEAGLSKRITREGWNKLRTEASGIVSATVTVTRKSVGETIKAADGSSQEGTNSLLQRLQRRLEHITEGWDSAKPPRTDLERAKALDLLSRAADIGKTLFGWGAGSTTTAVSVSLLSTAQVVRNDTPAIDVASVQVPTAPCDEHNAIAPERTAIDVPGAVTSRE